MIPTISVVGKKKAGKTTLIERLIAELTDRGYKIATIKHHVHYGFSMDEPGKDTWRHAAAGAETVIISSPDKLVVIKKTKREYLLGEIISSYLNQEDLIITEGYTKADTPKIVVLDLKEDLKLFSGVKKIIAIVTDKEVETKHSCFSFDDVKLLADSVEENFLRR